MPPSRRRIEHHPLSPLAARRFAFALLSALALSASLCAPAAAQDKPGLAGSCFATTYDAAHLAAHPRQRVAAIAVGFQSFADTLLATAVYQLRYGPKFGFGGDCHEEIDGGFICAACAGADPCPEGNDSFQILWAGGDEVEIVNETTGVLAENPAGGRDRLAAGGEHRRFVLKRAPAEDCAW